MQLLFIAHFVAIYQYCVCTLDLSVEFLFFVVKVQIKAN